MTAASRQKLASALTITLSGSVRRFGVRLKNPDTHQHDLGFGCAYWGEHSTSIAVVLRGLHAIFEHQFKFLGSLRWGFGVFRCLVV
jgi:hypothetical protein